MVTRKKLLKSRGAQCAGYGQRKHMSEATLVMHPRVRVKQRKTETETGREKQRKRKMYREADRDRETDPERQ